MRNALFQAICKVGIFMICAQAIVHFRPREAYEKYLKLLVSIMILLQLFLPIGNFFLGSGMEQVAQRLERFREGLEQEMGLEAEEAARADEILERMTLEEVRRRMEEQKREAQQEMAEEGGESPAGNVSETSQNIEISVEVGPIETVIIE